MATETKQTGARKRVPVVTRKGGSVVVKAAAVPVVEDSKPTRQEPAATSKGE